jgi:hypothetical protein
MLFSRRSQGDPDPRQMGLDHPAQLLDALGDLQGIGTSMGRSAVVFGEECPFPGGI